MKGNKLLIMGMAMMLVAGIMSPLAAAGNDSLHVIMTVEDRKYTVENTINILIRVYDKGVLTDLASAGDAHLIMSTNHALRNPINITLTRQNTGVYQGSYIVTADDVNRNLYFFYEVVSGNDKEEGRFTIRTHSVQDTVVMTIAGQKEVPAKPGDTLTATALVRTGTTPRPITGFANLYIEAPDGTRQNLTHTIRDTGIYDVNVIVPAVSVSGTYEVVAQPINIGQPDSVFIHVNVLDVWYHKVYTAGNTVSFEICVANNDGAPVEGANFYIRRNGWPNDDYIGVTNASGRSLLSVPDISGVAGFSGYVLAGGLNQSITGTVFNPVASQPHHSNFDIVWEGTDTIFKPNTQVSIPYGAYSARVPASSKTVFYYVTARGTDFAMFGDAGSHVEGPREVMAAGSVATDSLGKFNIAFRTPARQCAIDIRLEVPLDRAGFTNQTYDSDGMNLYDMDDDMYYAAWPQHSWDTAGFVFHAYEGKLDGDKGVTLKIGNFKPGRVGKVTVTMDAGLGNPVHAFWGVGEWSLTDQGSYDPEWMRWVPAGNVVPLEIDEKGKYQGEFTVPQFITGQDITVAAGYVDSQGLPHFEVKTQSPGSGTPWMWIGIAIVIIVTVIIVIYVGKEKMWF